MTAPVVGTASFYVLSSVDVRKVLPMYQPSFVDAFVRVDTLPPKQSSCPLASSLLSSAGEQLQAGQLIGAAASLRISIEVWSRSRCRRHEAWGSRPDLTPFWAMIRFLLRQGILSRADRTTLMRIYGHASAVMHGGPCDREQLREAIADATAICK